MGGAMAEPTTIPKVPGFSFGHLLAFRNHRLAWQMRLMNEFGLSVIDASLAITDQQHMVRNLVSRQLEKPTPAPALVETAAG